MTFVSHIELKVVNETLIDELRPIAIQDELNQFKRNNVWELVRKLSSNKVIETKWVFGNKLEKNGNVLRNKSRLIAKGYNQHDHIGF